MNDLELNLQIIRADCKKCGVDQDLTDTLCSLFAKGLITFKPDPEAGCLIFVSLHRAA